MDAGTAQRLAKIAPLQTLTLTHRGRKSGKPYDVVIWFVVEGERMFLATANKNRNWVRNVMVKPNVVIKVSGENFTATVSEITDNALREHVTNLVQAKYWYAMAFIVLGRLLQRAGIVQDNTGAFEVHVNGKG
jgi:deazaflavin-dependent oxidoreductase (nitroreductase family)